MFRTTIEPFRIHSVEPLRLTTPEYRAAAIRDAGYNVFGLRAADVLIDLLTDSGTGAMSRDQWAAIQHGDESYAGSPSWFVFLEAVKELFPFAHVIPTHQGRAAERILFAAIGGPGKVVPNNTHFDTTRANVEYIRAVRAVCDRHGVPLYLDACRFAENAWFIREREPGQGNRDVADIVRELASLADGMTISAKKDPLANIGGWLATNDDELAERCRALLVLTEGFPTYGGLAGRDLEAIAQGLKEAVSHDYLRYRIRSTAYLGDGVERAGIPIVKPVGGHAVYIDARALLPHVPPLRYPGQAVVVALYEAGGVRGCEIGTVMFGRRPDGTEVPAAMDLVRLAVPRRTYTQSHIDYVIEVCALVAGRATELTGFRILDEPAQLRHFTARFEPAP
jgi:tryptophanase